MNALFTEITTEESAIVSGGGYDPTKVNFDWNTFFFYAGVASFFGVAGLVVDGIKASIKTYSL